MLGALVWTCKSRGTKEKEPSFKKKQCYYANVEGEKGSLMFSLAGKRQKKRVQKRRMLEYLSSTDDAGDKNINFPFISFENIVTATDNFSESNLLGKGGFGKVYKVLVKKFGITLELTLLQKNMNMDYGIM
jgi:hypothetical protein